MDFVNQASAYRLDLSFGCQCDPQKPSRISRTRPLIRMGKVFAESDNGPSHAARRLLLVVRRHDLRDKNLSSSGFVFGLHRNFS
jgi:hypothetical protein